MVYQHHLEIIIDTVSGNGLLPKWHQDITWKRASYFYNGNPYVEDGIFILKQLPGAPFINMH